MKKMKLSVLFLMASLQISGINYLQSNADEIKNQSNEIAFEDIESKDIDDTVLIFKFVKGEDYNQIIWNLIVERFKELISYFEDVADDVIDVSAMLDMIEELYFFLQNAKGPDGCSLNILGDIRVELNSYGPKKEVTEQCFYSFKKEDGQQVDLYQVIGGDLKEFEDMYVEMLLKVYADTTEEYFRRRFDERVRNILKDGVLVAAKIADKLEGFMFFQKESDDKLWLTQRIYREDLVGKAMTMSILHLCPEAKKIVVLCPKQSKKSFEFFESLGFVKSDFKVLGYGLDDYEGLEYMVR